jgi:hypothetical protein
MHARTRSARTKSLLARLWIVVGVAASVAATGCGSRHVPTDEEVRRDAFVRDLMHREGMDAIYGVSSRADVRFEQGFSGIVFDPPSDYRGKPFRWIGQRGVVRVASHGDKTMNLGAYGWVDPKVLLTRPVVSMSIDGQFVSQAVVDEKGLFWVGSAIPAPIVAKADWLTVDINLSSIAFHWADTQDLHVANILFFRWEELGATSAAL